MKIEEPVHRLIIPEMRKAWAIPQEFQMCILFDFVKPVRVFKRGTIYDEGAEEPFADYDTSEMDDMTETDEFGVAQQFNPVDYVYVWSTNTTLTTN